MKKRILGLVVCIAVLVMQVMPVMASPDDIGGTANVLDYAVTTVVTPTSLKIALNPNGYDITTKYVKTTDEEVDEDKTYFTVDEGVYSAVEDPIDDDIDTYYEAVISNAQIISLNYGMANKSTAAQTVKVDIKATYTSTDNKEAIEFVDEAAKAQAYNETSNPTGAAKNELKMYLAVASAATAESGESVTAATYKKSTAYDADTTYYTKSAGVYTEADVDDEDAFKAGEFYEETTTIGPEITAAQLCDVDMTVATGDSVMAFTAGTDDKANTSIAYKLDEATYSVKAGEIIDFDTTQAELADKLEMSGLGGVAAFTLTGAINPNADWTKADTTSITFTPTYTYEEATGEETAVEGGYNQISLKVADSAPSIATTTYTMTSGNAIEVTVNLGSGELAATDISSITYLSPSGSVKTLAASGNYSLSDNKITFSSSYINSILTADVSSRVHTIKFNDSENTEVEVTFNDH